MPKQSSNGPGQGFPTNKPYKPWTPQKGGSGFTSDVLQISKFNSDQQTYDDVDFPPQENNSNNFGYHVTAASNFGVGEGLKNTQYTNQRKKKTKTSK